MCEKRRVFAFHWQHDKNRNEVEIAAGNVVAPYFAVYGRL